MTPQERVGFLTKDTFRQMSVDEKWDVWFDFTVGEHELQKQRCVTCNIENEHKYAPRLSRALTVAHVGFYAVCAYLGGVTAGLLGFPIPKGH